ncbi:Kazal-type serine protease inhibitor family protein [Amphiplicatus metriothermophilus]|uniref:Kazal-type serine protease inhibitor domain-containing protein n=1 Tax=Amphiplicatus metriothermophilus TaxID=1519374 RepID=A0A239PSZ8_9PROT|nr:Kazal-type serine protease inhibitor family protein [Amphiplicatus metriothermophilus]MBB5519103.1 hypothetical protein [Amphiplicatus metriothermophilus]SNT73173.1 Kazal-type serine protease inhibitor domain-containing protein [Amphiplicatus metriothermophilus]
MARAAGMFAAAMLAAACASEGAKGGGDAGPAPGESGGLCGGVAGLACVDPADYCATPAGECVDVADAAGICRKRPQICTMEYRPVCGCDGRTYPSACSAASKGVSVAHEGECAG